MKGITKVKVYILWGDNRIKCICVQEGCKCKNKGGCDPDVIAHDRYEGIEECFKQDKYGK